MIPVSSPLLLPFSPATRINTETSSSTSASLPKDTFVKSQIKPALTARTGLNLTKEIQQLLAESSKSSVGTLNYGLKTIKVIELLIDKYSNTVSQLKLENPLPTENEDLGKLQILHTSASELLTTLATEQSELTNHYLQFGREISSTRRDATLPVPIARLIQEEIDKIRGIENKIKSLEIKTEDGIEYTDYNQYQALNRERRQYRTQIGEKIQKAFLDNPSLQTKNIFQYLNSWNTAEG